MKPPSDEHCFLGRQVLSARLPKPWFSDCVRFGLAVDGGGPKPFTVDFVLDAKDPSALHHAAHELEETAERLRAIADGLPS